MSRADMAEPSRRDFWLYVDEFQNFATESFATILPEGGRAAANASYRSVVHNPLPLVAGVLLKLDHLC